MLKSDILAKLKIKHNTLNEEDIETIFDIFIKKITNSLKKVIILKLEDLEQ